MAITRPLRRLVAFHGDSDIGIDGVVAQNGAVEGILHEVCHLVTLGISSDGVDDGESVLEAINSRGSDSLSALASDWDEIKALACEVHVLRRARLLEDEAAFLRANATTASWRHYDDEQALRLIERAVQTRASRRRARAVIRRIQKMARSLP